LDRRLRESLQSEIKRIHQEVGATFIFVTHDQDEALAMSDRIAVFNHGRIEQVGAAQALYERPETPFVAGFLGDSNLIEGRIEENSGSIRLVSGPLALEVGVVPEKRASSNGVLLIRPERVRVAPWDESPATDLNTVDGELRDVIYLGNRRRFVVQAGDRRFLADGDSLGSSCEVGEKVLLQWAPDDAYLLTLP
jgi:putative spermidine/putrescine transport system ATP-binding protein